MKNMNTLSSNDMLIGVAGSLLAVIGIVIYIFVSNTKKEQSYVERIKKVTHEYQVEKTGKEIWLQQYGEKKDTLNIVNEQLLIKTHEVAEKEGVVKVMQLQLDTYKDEANTWRKEAKALQAKNEKLVSDLADFKITLDSIKKDTVHLIMKDRDVVDHVNTPQSEEDKLRQLLSAKSIDSNKLKGYNADNMKSVITIIKGMLSEKDRQEVDANMEVFEKAAAEVKDDIDRFISDKIVEIKNFKVAMVKQLTNDTFKRLDLSLKDNVFKSKAPITDQELDELFADDNVSKSEEHITDEELDKLFGSGSIFKLEAPVTDEELNKLFGDDKVTEVLYEENPNKDMVLLSRMGVDVNPLPVVETVLVAEPERSELEIALLHDNGITPTKATRKKAVKENKTVTTVTMKKVRKKANELTSDRDEEHFVAE